MHVNQTPIYDQSNNPTGCCPRFNPAGWDEVTLHFQNKPFVKANTVSLAHVPLNMGRVFARVLGQLQASGQEAGAQHIVLSRDLSAFQGEHLFATKGDVQGAQMTTLSGDFLTKVFEGPFSDQPEWEGQLREMAENAGATAGDVWFFYTTCPKCAKIYGKNPVVGLVELKAA